MIPSLNPPVNNLAPAAIITPAEAGSTAMDDSEPYFDPHSLDFDAIPPEELDALIQKAILSKASSSSNGTSANPSSSSDSSGSERSLPGVATPTPKPIANSSPGPVINSTPAPIVNSTPAPIVNSTPAPIVNSSPPRSHPRSPRNMKLLQEINSARSSVQQDTAQPVEGASSTRPSASQVPAIQRIIAKPPQGAFIPSSNSPRPSSTLPEVFAVAVRTYSGNPSVASVFHLETFSAYQPAIRRWEAQTRAGTNPSFIAAKNHDEIIRWVREQGI